MAYAVVNKWDILLGFDVNLLILIFIDDGFDLTIAQNIL